MPVNYHQLPPDGLCPCSRFQWPFIQRCINMPAVANKGDEQLFIQSPPVSEESPFHTGGGVKAVSVDGAAMKNQQGSKLFSSDKDQCKQKG